MEPNFRTSALYAMDNLDLMRGMDSESVHLIHADPPFNAKRIYKARNMDAVAAVQQAMQPAL